VNKEVLIFWPYDYRNSQTRAYVGHIAIADVAWSGDGRRGGRRQRSEGRGRKRRSPDLPAGEARGALQSLRA